MYSFQTKKDYIKVIRSTIELAVLLFILYIIVRALFTFSVYVPYKQDVISGEDKGFIALSYFGVDREGSSTLISTTRLDQHLKALYDNGYVTITQDDIDAYYKTGEPLPDKALYLMFEDGRRDTAIFAQAIMENYNDKATVLSYADKFENTDPKFLQPKDISKLLKSSFWELGTNGYRLSYINVYDRYDNYIGELNSLEYSKVSQYLGRNYNQYLMDFIRDENDIPKESYNTMKKRIENDYKNVELAYTGYFGYVPKTYVLMHANTGRFGSNEKVSDVNEQCITDMFVMNFNREGDSLNTRESSIYDLTRMQPQAYWHTNHLLMRIRDDLDEADRDSITFVNGDESRMANWDRLDGAAEFDGDTIIITTESKSTGTLRLKNSENYKNYSLDVILKGNVIGTQNVWLRANEDASEGLCVSLCDNVLYLYDGSKDAEPLVAEDLYYFDGNEIVSVEEDEQAVIMGEYQEMSKYTHDFDRNKEIAEKMNPASVEDGAEEYVPAIQINKLGNRKLHIDLKDDMITIYLDDKVVAENVKISSQNAGYVLLQAEWGNDGFSQRNIADDVYDGVFEKLYISEGNEADKPLFSNRLEGASGVLAWLLNLWNSIINWFIKYL